MDVLKLLGEAFHAFRQMNGVQHVEAQKVHQNQEGSYPFSSAANPVVHQLVKVVNVVHHPHLIIIIIIEEKDQHHVLQI